MTTLHQNQPIVTCIPDDEWTGDINAAIPKANTIYYVADWKEEDGITYIKLTGLGNAWYLEKGFRALGKPKRRENVR